MWVVLKPQTMYCGDEFHRDILNEWNAYNGKKCFANATKYVILNRINQLPFVYHQRNATALDAQPNATKA
jgi:hypothetical protein